MHHVWYCIEAGSTFVKPIHIERRDEAAFLLTKLLLLDWTLSFHTRSYSSFANLSKYSKPFLSKAVLAKHVSGPLLLSAKVFLQPVILLLPYL